MSTATVNQPTTSTPTSAVDTTSELSTLAQVMIITGKTDQGDDILEPVQVNEEQGKEAETKGTIVIKVKGKETEFQVSSVTFQSFKFWKANTLDGVSQLFTDADTGKVNEDEICNMCNRGVSVKLSNKARQLLEATEDGKATFEFTEGVFDLAPYIAVTTSTRKTTYEKTLDTLRGMPDEQRKQIMEALAALQGLQ